MQSFQMKKLQKREEGKEEVKRKKERDRERKEVQTREKKPGGGGLFWVKDMQEFLELFL